MKQSKKNERAVTKLAELLGVTEQIKDLKPTGPSRQERKTQASREAEAVLAYVKSPDKFLKKNCDHCGGEFTVNRGNVSCCSDECRAASLLEIGIVWDWSKRTRWYAVSIHSKKENEPLVVGPQALSVVDEVLASRSATETSNLVTGSEASAPSLSSDVSSGISSDVMDIVSQVLSEKSSRSR